MKTQQLTAQQIQDIINGKEVVTVDPVKKGEIDSHFNSIKDLVSEKIQGIRNKEGKHIIQVGELVQAVNEKGEKQWYCPDCKKINTEKESIIHWVNKYYTVDEQPKPLLVGLEKIEREKYGDYKEFWFKTWVKS